MVLPQKTRRGSLRESCEYEKSTYAATTLFLDNLVLTKHGNQKESILFCCLRSKVPSDWRVCFGSVSSSAQTTSSHALRRLQQDVALRRPPGGERPLRGRRADLHQGRHGVAEGGGVAYQDEDRQVTWERGKGREGKGREGKGREGKEEK